MDVIKEVIQTITNHIEITSEILIIDDFFPDEYCDKLLKFAINPINGYDDEYNGYKSIDFSNYIANIPTEKILKIIENKIKFNKFITYDRSWCFCYDNISRGVPPHTDTSYLTINLWVTPNKSINNFSKNSLKIYHRKKPLDFHYNYNDFPNQVENFIKGVDYSVIPYKYNRAIIFRGSLFHETLGVDMKEGDSNKRVSYTFLFDK
jgi:hypothetical protein